MTSRTLKSKIDRLWEEFWTGGITNPLTVIEQISFLMFARLLDITETRKERIAQRTKRPYESIFSGDKKDLRWSQFKNLPAEEMLITVRDRVFPHFPKATLDGSGLGDFMKDAQLMIQKPSLLVSAVNMIDELPLTEGDTKGDLYEYLLSKLTTAGINGQFRTPRHIIEAMVKIIDPKPEAKEVVGDPACGTAGFLVGAIHYLMEKYTSDEGVFEDEEGNKTYTGDKLDKYRDHLETNMFYGFDFDATMLRIAAMNLLLHGVKIPHIHYQDTLSKDFTDKFPEQATEGFDVILANPPFKGSLDYEDVHPSVIKKIKTKKTELLFVALILRMLKPGGRCAMVVPDGVLFGSSTAHVGLRKMLIEENQLDAVIKLPSGVFRPYAGVSTAILVFTKGGRTDEVFYFDVQADGFSLDDKREKIDDNDLPDLVKRWITKNPKKDTERTEQSFFVPAEEIRENKYDLSLNRYKEFVYEEEEYDPPRIIIEKMRGLEQEIMLELNDLEEMLG